VIAGKRQQGFMLMTIIVMLFLFAAIAVLLNYDSATGANAASDELQSVQAEYVAQAALRNAQWLASQQSCTGGVTLTDVAFGNHKYSAAVTMASGGGGSQATTQQAVDQDTQIREGSASQNYGSNAELEVQVFNNADSQALYRFDISSIAAGTTIAKAVAKIFVIAQPVDADVNLYRITSDWQEGTATWDNMAIAYDAGIAHGSIPVGSPTGQFVDVDITGLVQQWVNGIVPNHGVMLVTNAFNDDSTYTSKEYGNVSRRPLLEVTTVSGQLAVSPATISVTGTLQNGVSRQIVRDNVPVFNAASPSTLVLQPGPEGKDSFIEGESSHQGHNKGSDKDINTDSESGKEFRGLLKFELGQVPKGSRVLSAELTLNMDSTTGAADTVEIHRITRSWTEDEVTWNSRKTFKSWSSPGGDFDPGVAGSFETAALGAVTADITELVAAWVDGSETNHGMILLSQPSSGNDEKKYVSSDDDADPALWPKLEITYACECGTACIVPQGSGHILMAVGDYFNPDPDDEFKKDLFESWGYTVSLIDDDTDPFTFGFALADKDVVYVSATVTSTSVDEDLENEDIGIVFEEENLVDDFGLATGSTKPVGDRVSLDDNSHFITAVFPIGDLRIFDAYMEGTTMSGTISPSAATLASWNGEGAVVALDKGGVHSGGGTSPNRRVLVPLGHQDNLNPDYVNHNGWLVVQRAIAWAMGAEEVPYLGKLLTVVGDANNPFQHDIDRRSLFESLGYEVTYIDDGANASEFGAGTAAHDVVHVSSTIDAAVLGSKLTSSSIGIVNEDTETSDDFGFGDFPNTSTFYDQFTTTAAAHYITEPFAGAGVTLFSPSQIMNLVSGTLAPDLYSAATIGALPWALPTLDVGVERWDGDFSMGRRVHLPSATAPTSEMTADYKTIFKRSLKWASGTGCNSMTDLLFVVSDSANPTSGELSRQSLLESWCYTVMPIDDSDSQTNFDAAAGSNDVVYVSGEASGSAIGTKLTGFKIGIVNEQTELHDDLGFSSSANSNDFYRVFVEDNAHFISTGYAAGWLTIATSDQTLYSLEGTVAPGLRNLMQVWISGANYKNGVAILEVGAELYDGGNAAGRRVQLPWGSAGFDFDALHDNGKTILHRSLVWAARKYTPPQTIVLATAANATLGGVSFTNKDIVQYDPDSDTAVVVLEGATHGITQAIDAVHITADGDVLFSMDANAAFKGSPYARDDIIRYDPETGVASMYLDGSTVLLGPGFRDIRGVHELDNGNLLLVNGYTSTIGGIEAGAEDAYIYNPASDTANFAVEGAAIGYNGQFDVVHQLDNGNLLLSVWGSNWVAGKHFTAGDIIEFDPVNVASSHYLDESVFAGTTDIRAVQVYDGELGSIDFSGGGGGGGGSDYVEKGTLFTISSSNSWQTVDLGVPGVPPNAIVEVAMENAKTNAQYEAGIRAVGTSAPTYDLHEAEGGGVDALVRHVQADANGHVQAFAESKDDVQFRLLGYWTTGAYTNLDGLFTVSSSGGWRTQSLSGFGVQPGQVVEMIVQNTNGSQEYHGGVRKMGSGNEQMCDIQESEAGGKNFHSVFVEASNDASASIQAYAENTGSIEFKPAGAWDTPPGTYTEHDSSINLGSPTANNTWQTLDLAPFGVPANAVVQITLANRNTGSERLMGVRAVGSSLDRYIDLHEAEAGGEELVTLHVKADANSRIEWYHERPADSHRFHLMGWWVLN
jgi:hypothetical protein